MQKHTKVATPKRSKQIDHGTNGTPVPGVKKVAKPRPQEGTIFYRDKYFTVVYRRGKKIFVLNEREIPLSLSDDLRIQQLLEITNPTECIDNLHRMYDLCLRQMMRERNTRLMHSMSTFHHLFSQALIPILRRAGLTMEQC